MQQNFGAAPGRSGGSRSGAASGARRRLIDVAEAARGRTPVQYSLELIPFFASELPAGVGRLSFVWERGSKVLATEAASVNPHTHACFWGQQLRQVATFYQDQGIFAPKEYSLKVQAVTRNGSHEERRTVGKTRIDLSRYCNTDTEPLPQEVFLDLKPAGRLNLSIKAGWLRDAPPLDPETLTEVSFTTLRSGTEGGGLSLGGGTGGEGQDYDEQDLSGFEAGGGGVAPADAALGSGPRSGHLAPGAQQRAPQRASLLSQGEVGSRRNAPLAATSGAGGVTAKAAPLAGPTAGAVGGGSPRISAFGGGGAHQQAAAPLLVPQGEREELKARVRQVAEQHVQAMEHYSIEGESQAAEASTAAAPPLGFWARLHALFCGCCWPRQRAGSQAAAPEPGTVAPTTVDAGDGPVEWSPTSAEL